MNILDVCCGSKMFWFDKKHQNAIFMDKRREKLIADTREGRRKIVIDPDIVGDFQNIPFLNSCFSLVIFDPPHLTRNGKKSWMAKKYGTLKGDWKNQLSRGFSECFRVLKPEGILIFKWNEYDILLSEILKLIATGPLVGNHRPKNSKTHWLVFMKQIDSVSIS